MWARVTRAGAQDCERRMHRAPERARRSPFYAGDAPWRYVSRVSVIAWSSGAAVTPSLVAILLLSTMNELVLHFEEFAHGGVGEGDDAQ